MADVKISGTGAFNGAPAGTSLIELETSLGASEHTDIASLLASPGNIPNSNLADMAAATIKGRALGAGSGQPQDLTPSQVRSVVGTYVDEVVNAADFAGVNQNNLNPTGLQTARILRIGNSGGNVDLTGITAPSPVLEKVLMIHNRNDGGLRIRLTHNDAASVAANRFFLPNTATFNLNSFSGAILVYDVTHSRWVVVGRGLA